MPRRAWRMADHYFTADPQSAHRYASCEYAYRGETLRFITDAGVFSRGEMDFGTDVLLRSLPDPMAGRTLDIGCGWGAIGVTVGKRYPECRLTLCDINERAVDLSRKNAENNGVRAEIVQSDGLSNVSGTFDCILTNPPIRAGKQVIYAIFAEAAKRLKENGSMYLVIRKQQGADSAVKYLKTLFAHVEVIEKSGGFHVIRCREALYASV